MSVYNTDGFISIHQVQDYTPTQPVFTSDSLFTANVYEAPDGYEQDKILGCNISFDMFSSINLTLPGVDFFNLESYPNLTLFNKADQFSYEISMINDMLISAIEEMGCCDIARKYNTTMVPFFRYFADHPDVDNCGFSNAANDSCSWGSGDNFISTLIEVVKTITSVQAVVEPLMCLIKPLPGNPWLPFDTDFLQWAYSYQRKAGPYVDKIMSGEAIDIILNPVANFRRKLQICISSKRRDSYYDLKAVGDYAQLARILAVAARDGNSVAAANIPQPVKPVIPLEESYTSAAAFDEATAIYTIEAQKYNQDYITWKKLQREIEDMTRPYSSLSNYQAEALQTKALLGGANGNLCSCVINAVGLENLMPTYIDIHSSRDIFKLVGKQLDITYAEANISDRIHDTSEKLIFLDEYQYDQNKLARILSASEKSRRFTKIDIIEDTTTSKNPYSDTLKANLADIEVPSYKITRTSSLGNGWDIYNTNEKIIEKIKELKLARQELAYDISLAERETLQDFNQRATLAKRALNASFDNIKSNPAGDLTGDLTISYEIAQNLYNNYFNDWNSYDMNRDPSDWRARSAYLDPNDISSVNTVSTYTPVIDDGEIASDVRIDARTETIYFNNGLTYRGGSDAWRTNNPMSLPTGAFTQSAGSISYLRTADDFLAIFPNIAIGLQAGIDWIYFTFSGLTISEFVYAYELDEFKAGILLRTLGRALNLPSDVIIDNLNADLKVELVRVIAEFNGFEVGEVWLNGERISVAPFIDTVVNGAEEITPEVLNNLPQFIQGQVNNNLVYRGSQYADVYRSTEHLRVIDDAINELEAVLESNAAARILYLKSLPIPCTCENFLCSLLQMVVNYILGLFNELMRYISDLVLKYLIPDFIMNIIKLVMEKVRCLVALFNVGHTLEVIDDAARLLLEDLRYRVSLYPDGACFIPNIAENNPAIDNYGDIPYGDPGNPWTDANDNPWDYPNFESVSLEPDADYPNNPSTGIDDPGVVIINDPGVGTIIESGTRLPNFGIPVGNDLPKNGLGIKLVLTDGININNKFSADANIPTLHFDCKLSQADTRFTSCNQKFDSTILVIP